MSSSSSSTERSVNVGPWGGSGGDAWRFELSTASNPVRVQIGYSNAIESIKFESQTPGSIRSDSTSIRAGTGSIRSIPAGNGSIRSIRPNVHKDTVLFFVEGEYLINISGYYGVLSGSTTSVIRSLTFTTSNRQVHGPYGPEEGTRFSVRPDNATISAIYGYSGSSYLKSIGVNLSPIRQGVILLGPWGGNGGEAWGSYDSSRLEKITVRYDRMVIHSIAFTYSTTTGNPPVRGGPGGFPKEMELCSGEYITSIKGFYGMFGDMLVVKSLTFVTNFDNSCKWGDEQGTPFFLPLSSDVIVGFHGRSGLFLDALGIFVK